MYSQRQSSLQHAPAGHQTAGIGWSDYGGVGLLECRRRCDAQATPSTHRPIGATMPDMSQDAAVIVAVDDGPGGLAAARVAGSLARRWHLEADVTLGFGDALHELAAGVLRMLDDDGTDALEHLLHRLLKLGLAPVATPDGVAGGFERHMARPAPAVNLQPARVLLGLGQRPSPPAGHEDPVLQTVRFVEGVRDCLGRALGARAAEGALVRDLELDELVLGHGAVPMCSSMNAPASSASIPRA